MPQDAKMRPYSWEEFEADAKKIADTIQAWGKNFAYVYGPPRGGLMLAVRLSHLVPNLQFVATLSGDYEDLCDQILIVDDITDTGKTLERYQRYGFFIATLFKHPNSAVAPDIWIREKDDRWVEFPWETK